MPIAISDDHLTLAATAADLLENRDARGATRALLDAPDGSLPEFWEEIAALGWLGLHAPEDLGGSGFGLEELVVVVEESGRAVAPGPFVPTVIASAVLVACGDRQTQQRLVPGLVDGSTPAGIALAASVEVDGDMVSGQCDAVLGGALAQLVMLPSGDDVLVVERGDGVSIEVPASLDASRRSARARFDGARATVLPGARRHLVDLSRLVLSAEAVGR